MTEPMIYNALKASAALLAVAAAMIAVAVNVPDLGLTKQGIAVLVVVQAGIAALLAFLPSVKDQVGTVRGSGSTERVALPDPKP